ncbi:MAG: heavy metal translocating P-type ATPase, partial [Lachnospiraceae bacterium]|nr:heavy metal translocating P-type ATPase [Lachnospiraceae bacterium]
MQELVISILLAVVIIMASVVLIFIGSRKGGLTKKQRTMMIRILITAVILLSLQFISAELFDTIDGYLFPSAGRWIRFACYLIDYFIIGYDILR